MKKIWIVIVLAVCSGHAMATVIFEDNFETHEGALHNRRPDSWDTSVGPLAYWKNEALNFQVTNGVLKTTDATIASAWLTLPTISAGEIIRVSAVVVGNGDANNDYVGIGLLQSKNHTYQRGEPWIAVTHKTDSLGLVQVYGGLGLTSILATANNLKEAQGFTTNLNARNTVNYEYDTGSGNLSVWLVSEGGTTVTQYNGSVNYNGVAGAIVPLDELNYFGITFKSVTPLSGSNPAYLDNLTVEIIPEPATIGLCVVAGLGVMLLRRMKL